MNKYKALARVVEFLDLVQVVTKLRVVSNATRKLVNTVLRLSKQDRVFHIKRPSNAIQVPNVGQHSHILQLFNVVQISLRTQEIGVADWRLLLYKLERLKVPNMQYHVDVRDMDDLAEGRHYLKAMIK